jgi:site-specific recombinase XerD
MLPTRLCGPIKQHLHRVRQLHESDLAQGFGSVYLPSALARTYGNGLRVFLRFLAGAGLDPEAAAPTALTNALVRDYLDYLVAGNYAASTKRLYTSALKGFLKYLHQRELAPGLDLQILFDFAANQLPRVGQRLPQFPRDEIEAVIRYAEDLGEGLSGDEKERLIDLRDRAFILTLADTGLRVQEACSLRRAQIEWHEGRAIVAGKGDKQAVVRFSKRALAAIREYLAAREPVLDRAAGKQLSALPVFTGHGLRNLRRKGGQVRHRLRPITTETGRAIIRTRAQEALGKDVAEITPHAFRHYFVTNVLLGTGNLKLAQRLARHSDISSTQRYAHLSDTELDQAYEELFNA